MDYPKELFHHERGVSRVTFGPEEHANLIADEGYSDEREPGKRYRVHTAEPVSAYGTDDTAAIQAALDHTAEAELALDDLATPEPPRRKRPYPVRLGGK